MSGEYEDIEAYEDEIYCEESSSETSFDSDIEFHLYSQVHYAQDLRELSEEQECVEKDTNSKTEPTSKEEDYVVPSDSDIIQISDDTDVITVSDKTDEDSIYNYKGKKAPDFKAKTNQKGPIGHSTPNTATASRHAAFKDGTGGQRHTKGVSSSERTPTAKIKSRSLNVLETVIVEESSEKEDNNEGVIQDSEESDESDPIENWMLLGDSKEETDKSITLNLEGCRASTSDQGEAEAEWSISEKDREAQIANNTPGRRLLSRYYTADKNVRCRNCDKQGHLSKNCPTPKKSPACCLCGVRGHLQNSCPERLCSNCNLPGHFYRECIERAYWKKQCHRCEMTGHYADACPEIWRQYHITVLPGPPVKSRDQSAKKRDIYCYNCARKGHYGHDCSERRMVPGSFPTSPFVYYYDNEYDIIKRERRICRKIEELQEAGLWDFPLVTKRSRCETDSNAEPPRKKKAKGTQKDTKEEQHKYSKKKKKQRTEKQRKKKKQKKEILTSDGMEDAFPRGSNIRYHVVNAASHQHYRSPVLFTHDHKAHSAFPIITKKKRKRERKRARKAERSDADESLFLIKQRKKKKK